MATRATALPAEERRAAIVAAAMPLLLERGAHVSTRQIAEAACVAEGTIFSVFPDKDAVLQAVIEAALDPEPTERELEAIDASLAFEDQLIAAVAVMQRRVHNIWRLLSSVGDAGAPRTPPRDFAALTAMLRREQGRLRTDPAMAARQLRALTMAFSNQAFLADAPMTPAEIVTVFLDGVRTRESAGWRGGGGR